MNSPQSEETSEPSVNWVFRLARDQMLPAICPACSAPGTRPERVLATRSKEHHPELDAHFCDICASELSARKTRQLGLLAACGILVISAATTCALALGTRDLPLQIFITAAVGVLVPELLVRTGIWNTTPSTLTIEREEDEFVLVCRSRGFAQVLRQHGFSEKRSEPDVLPPPLRRRKSAAGLLVGGLAWLGLVHSLGGAEVRVVVGGKERAVLLVDARHSGTIAPTNAEDPRAGQSLRILGGRRQLELIAHSGARLGGATRTIWPGRTYIVGQLPKGQCLFWERRKYGQDGSKSLVFPVGGEGPVWELKDPVDSWFLPLDGGASENDPPEADWDTSGGIRRAVRLLPCRGSEPF